MCSQSPCLLWATDVHLDHLPPEDWHEFGLKLKATPGDHCGVVLTGDIADASRICDALELVQAAYAGPVHFVLGNHDYYRGSFAKVDEDVARICQQVRGLHWLNHQVTSIAPGIELVGTDGWYDARFGNPESDLNMSDFMLIEELFEAQDESRAALVATLRRRADTYAATLASQLRIAASRAPRAILVATHVPPFRDAAWYRDEPPNDTWAPFFTSKATGDALLEASEAHPEIHYTVLCGHTHYTRSYQERPNLTVHTGFAKYGHPQLTGRVSLTPSLTVGSPQN